MTIGMEDGSTDHLQQLRCMRGCGVIVVDSRIYSV
jgi:hypothetical protein